MRRHEANFTGLLSGLLFIGLGAYALAAGPDHLANALRWVWPVTLLGLGIALLVGSSATDRLARGEVSASDEPHGGGDSERSERS